MLVLYLTLSRMFLPLKILWQVLTYHPTWTIACLDHSLRKIPTMSISTADSLLNYAMFLFLLMGTFYLLGNKEDPPNTMREQPLHN